MGTRKKTVRTGGKWIPVLLILSAFFLLFLSAGCSTDAAEPAADPRNGVYLIYRLDTDGVTLLKDTASVQGSEPKKIADALLTELMQAPGNGDGQSIFPADVTLLGTELQDSVYTADFSSEYLTMNRDREVILRAGLAKTLTQIEGIDYIRVTSGGQPLMDSAGNPLGTFSGSDFVDSIANINSYERMELTLYFADESGQKLQAETREAVHSTSTSTERLVVEQLIAGSQENLGAVLPKDTRILNVSSTDGICYVNFDTGFLTAELPATDSLAVYSIVDSLTELKTVSRVQLMVGGSADVSFHSVSLEKPFERDASWIVQAE
jgi:germination protein M